MKYHKIRGVPLDVCSCEQKIAYNLAFTDSDMFRKEYRTAVQKSAVLAAEVVHEAVVYSMRHWKRVYANSRYDEDAIFCALNAGIAGYLEKPFIATSYEQIGKAFPANYLNRRDESAAA